MQRPMTWSPLTSPPPSLPVLLPLTCWVMLAAFAPSPAMAQAAGEVIVPTMDLGEPLFVGIADGEEVDVDTVLSAVEPPSTSAPDAPVSDEVAPGLRTPRWFKKGEITALGAVGLVRWEDRLGLRAGVARLGESFYLQLTPMVSYVVEDLGGSDLLLSFVVPLRFQLLDGSGTTTDERFGGIMRFRTEDWDAPADYVKLIRQLTYGRKEDHFYVNLSGYRTGTLGHGTLLKRYNPNLNLSGRKVSFELDAHGDYVGIQTYLNNVAPPNMAAALVFFKPLSLVDADNYVLRSFSLGLSGVIDWDAPLVNRLDIFDKDQDGRRDELLLSGDDGEPVYANTTVVGWGVDAEIKFFKSADRTVDMKAYVDVSTLNGQVPRPCDAWQDPVAALRCPALFSDDPVTLAPQPEEVETTWKTSMGGSLGVLARFTLGPQHDHAIRARLEGRLYEPSFQPGYFDTFYEAQRLYYRSSNDPRSSNLANQTKVRQILEREGDGLVFGGALELSYQYWEMFEVGLGLQLAKGVPDNGFFVHLGVPQTKWLSLRATFQKTASTPDTLFTSLDNSILMAEARLRLFEFLHLTAEAFVPFAPGSDSRLADLYDVNVGLEISFGL